MNYKDMKTNTPLIKFDDNQLFITGNSYPIESDEFWLPIAEKAKKINNLNIKVDLGIFNTSSIYYLTSIFRLENINQVVWLCEDDMDEEIAIDIKSIIGNKFTTKKII